MNYRILLQMLMPMLEGVAQGYIDQDENHTGADDVKGEAIMFAVKIFKAVLAGKEMPKAPASLK